MDAMSVEKLLEIRKDFLMERCSEIPKEIWMEHMLTDVLYMDALFEGKLTENTKD